MGIGFSRDTLFVQIQQAAINIVGIIVFIYIFGFYGFCVAYSLARAYSFWTTNYYYRKRFNKAVDMYRAFKDKVIIIGSLCFLIVSILFSMALNSKTVVDLILFCLLFLISYAVFIWKFRIINSQDIRSLTGK